MAESKPVDAERYRARLQELRSQLETDLDTQQQREMNLSGGPDEPGPGQHWERSGYGDHQADDATELFEREKSMGMTLTLQEHMRQVDHALSRIEAGSYGQCEQCGRPIGEERLDAMPEATLCIDCKSQQEEQTPVAQRRDLKDSLTRQGLSR